VDVFAGVLGAILAGGHSRGVVKVPEDTTQSYTRGVQPKPHFFTLWPTLFLCNIYGIEKGRSGYQKNILSGGSVGR
jgi:hypothetical protein